MERAGEFSKERFKKEVLELIEKAANNNFQ
jgi:hypothetical protein